MDPDVTILYSEYYIAPIVAASGVYLMLMA